MADEWTVVISQEVRDWFDQQTEADQILVRRIVNKLRILGNQLRMPHSRTLGNGLHELRFTIKQGKVEQRITYIFDIEHHIIMLTTFTKTRNNERKQVQRAREAQNNYANRRKQ